MATTASVDIGMNGRPPEPICGTSGICHNEAMALLPEDLVTALGAVRSVGVITGAGVSAESGISTYRGEGGIYDDPDEGDRTVEALTGATLARDPDRTWRAIAKLARQSSGAKPNAGHEAIAAIERNVDRFVLLTQNVDGLHQAAGSRNVIDIHGTVSETVCMGCGMRGKITPERVVELDGAPDCPTCFEALRPNAVLFGEMLPPEKVMRIHTELNANPPDLVILAGTTAMFPYIAEPVFVAKNAGRLTIEVNPERTQLSTVVDHWLEGKAGQVLPAIARALA